LEDHLKGCADCRREAFYFSGIAACAGRLEKAPVRPDFNVRLRAAIRRSEVAASTPKPWYRPTLQPLFRPVLAFGLLVLTLGGGVTGYVLTHDSESGPMGPAASTEAIVEWQPVVQPGMTPVGDMTAEDQRVRQYIDTNGALSDYVIETYSVEDLNAEKHLPQYFNPVVPAEQMARQVSY